MSTLSKMDRCSRARWQAAAARKRQWYARPGIPGWRRSSGVIASTRFTHGVLLRYARTGKPFDPYWWA